jgi:hypothetical protein
MSSKKMKKTRGIRIMALRRIVTLPDPVLKRKARAVTQFDKNLHTLLDDMVETMREAPGVGLAAPQIGLSERIAVIEYYEKEEDEEKEDAPKKVWAVVNPEIVKASQETLMGVEGCLSIRSARKGDEPSWQAGQDQSQRLAGAHFSTRDRPPQRNLVHRTRHARLATRTAGGCGARGLENFQYAVLRIAYCVIRSDEQHPPPHCRRPAAPAPVLERAMEW